MGRRVDNRDAAMGSPFQGTGAAYYLIFVISSCMWLVHAHPVGAVGPAQLLDSPCASLDDEVLLRSMEVLPHETSHDKVKIPLPFDSSLAVETDHVQTSVRHDKYQA
jgi:hypothetical protein